MKDAASAAASMAWTPDLVIPKPLDPARSGIEREKGC
jgi:hypothetical protein